MIMIEIVIFHRHYHSIQSFNYAIHFSPFTSHNTTAPVAANLSFPAATGFGKNLLQFS